MSRSNQSEYWKGPSAKNEFLWTILSTNWTMGVDMSIKIHYPGPPRTCTVPDKVFKVLSRRAWTLSSTHRRTYNKGLHPLFSFCGLDCYLPQICYRALRGHDDSLQSPSKDELVMNEKTMLISTNSASKSTILISMYPNSIIIEHQTGTLSS